MSETCAIGTNNPVTSTHSQWIYWSAATQHDVAIKTDGQHADKHKLVKLGIKMQVMTGYYGQEDETKRSFSPLTVTSGDIGLMDKMDFFKIIDRKKTRLLSGFNVFPNELENVISTCPESSNAAIGIDDEQQGESIKVFIVKDDPALSEADVAAFCKQQLTGL
jgi:acyl-CoA synthetase (AMP-forming)/AMP-acid ligase II